MIAHELWQSLQNYLTIDAYADVPPDAQPNTPVMVKVTVTNTAPSADDQPKVVFEGVGLKVREKRRRGFLLGRQLGRRLQSGQSITTEVRCDVFQLPNLELQVEARVSHRNFFGVRQAAGVSWKQSP